ncbi:hypothetical protein [Mucilaginibacter sp. UR6-11]|uniref:hypothetical protein n=1 Tax=Mucilaginibacter sp. UR6-11 TaxID=1435644 RepID=UPI001E3DD05F|nr:hypothetical protein [Mucilaginibacter sp. UR6-11]MCC8423596.1 hypothetical protein [Mucilaginibacter sp. UR6-11]
MSPNSPAVNINIKTITTNEVSALSYKGISGFKKYPAAATTGTYIFEGVSRLTEK